jgi:DNA-binding transcriptional LysR family regulator
MNAEPGWADLELARRIAEAKTLSGAARALGVDQTTAARRLAAIERRIGASLFDRVGGRLAPTPALATVLDRLQAMDEDATVALAALRRAEAEARGLARIDSVGFVLARALAPALGAFARAHPRIVVALHADDRNARFDRRDTDIAVRLGRTGDDAASIRKLGELRFRLCRAVAAPAGGEPPPLVRYSEALDGVPEMRLLDRLRPGARVAVRSDRLDALVEAAAALGAEAMLPEAVARRDPRFVIVDEAAAIRPVCRLVHLGRARAAAVAAATRWVDETVAAWTRES